MALASQFLTIKLSVRGMVDKDEALSKEETTATGPVDQISIPANGQLLKWVRDNRGNGRSGWEGWEGKGEGGGGRNDGALSPSASRDR